MTLMEEVFDAYPFAECEVIPLAKREQVAHGPSAPFLLDGRHFSLSRLLDEAFHVGLYGKATSPGLGGQFVGNSDSDLHGSSIPKKPPDHYKARAKQDVVDQCDSATGSRR